MREIDPQKVIDTINEQIQAIQKGFDPEKISIEGREDIIKQIDEIEKIALAIKAKLAE